MRCWRILPDVEAVFRRFPVLAVMLLGFTGLLLAYADGALIGPLRMDGNSIPTERYILVLGLAALFGGLAVVLYGEAEGWGARRHLGGVIAALVLWGLYYLPYLAPGLAAKWLPLHADFQLGGVALLALAAMGAGYSGAAANQRIMTGLGIAIAAVAIVLLVSALLQAGTGAIQPWPLVLLTSAVLLLSLSWLTQALPTRDAAGPVADLGDAATSVGFIEVLRRLVLPLLFLMAVGTFAILLRHLADGTLPGTQGIPMVVEPATLALVLMTAGYLLSAPLHDTGGTMIASFVRAGPWLLGITAVTAIYGLACEIRAVWSPWGGLAPGIHPVFHSSGALHIEDQLLRWLFGAVALLAACIAVFRRSSRDLRLPLAASGAILCLAGAGPWSMDRLVTAQLNTAFDGVMREAKLTPGRALAPASELRWNITDSNVLHSLIQRLAANRALGMIEPWFRNAADNPFAKFPLPNTIPGQTELGIYLERRLGLAGRGGTTNLPPAVTHPAVAAREVLPLGLSSNRPVTIPLGAFDTMISNVVFGAQVNAGQSVTPRLLSAATAGDKPGIDGPPVNLQIEVSLDGKAVVRFWGSRAEARFDLAPLLQAVQARAVERRAADLRMQASPAQPREIPLPLLAAPQFVATLPGGVRARMVVTNLSGQLIDGKWQNFNATGYLLVNAADMEVKR
jgi:hypothetical protein